MKLRYLVLFLFFGCTLSNSTTPILLPNSLAVQIEEIPFAEIKPKYLWLENYEAENCIIKRISLPENYKRTLTDSTSFAAWLQHIPLKPGVPKVHLYNGALKNNQEVHAAILDIDVGTKDLQQCADAVMRLRAEYLLANDKIEELSFNFTSGHPCGYKKWAEGFRPVIQGNNVNFVQSKPKDYSYSEFKNYMEMIFNYCGTYSLSQELKSKTNLNEIAIGDVFIHGGFPGHAVIVVDLAEHEKTGEKIFLLAQSYMPAQEIHILKNFDNNSLSPWFSANFVDQLNTPEWIFQKNELKHF